MKQDLIHYFDSLDLTHDEKRLFELFTSILFNAEGSPIELPTDLDSQYFELIGNDVVLTTKGHSVIQTGAFLLLQGNKENV